MHFRKPQLSLKRAPSLVVICFFLYKTTESLLQSSNRIHLYTTVCASVANHSNSTAVCDMPERPDFPVSYVNRTLPGAGSSDQVETSHSSGPANRVVTVQRLAGGFLLAYRCALNVPATISCLIYGCYSNRVGRKLAMILPGIGAIIACGWFGCSLIPWISPVPEAACFILVGALCYGVCGKSSAMGMGANSYITDLSSRKDRTKLLGRLLGANCFGLCIGAGLLALFYHYTGVAEIIMFAAVSNLIVLLTILIFVPESLGSSVEPILNTIPNRPKQDTCVKQNTSDESNKKKSFCESVRESYRFLIQKRVGNLRAAILFLFISVLFNQMTKSGEQDVILLFTSKEPFRWSAEVYGYYLSVYYGCMAILLTFILPIMETYLSPRDTTLIILGMAFKIARLLTMGLTSSTLLLFITAVSGSFAGFISSGVRSLLTKLVQNEDVGASFALISCMETMANLVGGSLFTGIYNLTVAVFPGAVFLVDSVLHAAILIAFIWLRFQIRDYETDQPDTNQ